MRILRVLLFAFCLCLTEVQNTECVIIELFSIINNAKIPVLVESVCGGFGRIEPGESVPFELQPFLLPKGYLIKIKVWDTDCFFLGKFCLYINEGTCDCQMLLSGEWVDHYDNIPFDIVRGYRFPYFEIERDGTFSNLKEITTVYFILQGNRCQESKIKINSRLFWTSRA